MVFSFSDCGSALLEWIRRASSLEPHEDAKVEISPKIRSYRPDLILMACRDVDEIVIHRPEVLHFEKQCITVMARSDWGIKNC